MADPLQQMVNDGISRMLEDDVWRHAEKTLVVVGTARGGTSAVAGALDRLGVFTGALSAGPVFEDVNLSASIESGTPQEAQDIIDSYNAEHGVWAYKRPRLLYHLQDVHNMFRNPVYLVVFRDVFAAAQRTRISGGVDIFLTMKKLLGDNQRILDFIICEKPNAVLISYEKLLANPALIVDQLIELIGQTVDEEVRSSAIEFIQPAPDDYLDATRTNKASGQVTGISGNRVQGWAKYNYPLKPAATVELAINGTVIASTLADRPAADARKCELTTADLPTDSECTFRFDLPDHSIDSGDQVSVKASEDITDLDNCPLRAELPHRGLPLPGPLRRWARRRNPPS